MRIPELIDHLADRGVTFTALDDGGLKVVGADRLAPAERDTLKAHKAKLWAHLRRAANDTRLPTLSDLAAALGPAFAIEVDDDARVMVDTRDVLAHADEDDMVDLLTPSVLAAFGASLASDGKVSTWIEATPPEPPPEPLATLADLPLLADDKRYIESRLARLCDEDAADLLAEYRRRWLEAADAEPNEVRRDNAGRRAANLWLLDPESQS